MTSSNKYSAEVINQILSMSRKGYSSRQIAGELSVSKSGVNDLLQRTNGLSHADFTASTEEPKQQGPRILFYDLETAIAKVYAFGRRKQYINQDAIDQEGGWLLCAGYREGLDGKTEVLYNKSQLHKQEDFDVCYELWHLFHNNDVIVAHNVKSFDLKMLEVRCLANGLPPLPSVQVIDTLEIAKKKFRFPSNGLDALAAYLGIGRKTQHSGVSLWIGVQGGDEEALDTMIEYCSNDVDLLVDVFKELASRGLVSGFNAAMYYDDDKMRCHVCGSDDAATTGRYVFTAASRFKEVRCNSCGAVGRTRVNDLSKEKRQNLVSAIKV